MPVDDRTHAGIAHAPGVPEVDGDPLVEGILAIARLETFVLATALQSDDDDSVLLAAVRLRRCLACAHQFAARSISELAGVRLAAVVDAAERWLPAESRISVTPETLRRVLAESSQSAVRLGTIDADDTLIIAFNLDDLPLGGIVLRGATVAQVSARRARLDMANASSAKIARSCFDSASLRRGVFDDAVLEECDLSRTNLQGTTWRGATVSRCHFAGAVFFDACLRGARFVECDLVAGAAVHHNLLHLW